MFYVHEIQTDANGASNILTDKFSDIGTAQQKYFTILASASVSTVNKHTAVLMDDEGMELKRECIYHRSSAV